MITLLGLAADAARANATVQKTFIERAACSRPSMDVKHRLLFLSLAVPLLVPLASAAANPTATNIQVISADGDALLIVPLGELVRIRAFVNNTGDTDLSGAVNVRYEIVSADGGYRVNQTVRKTVNLAPGNQTTVDYSWSPSGRRAGNHTVTVTVEGSSESPLAKSFRVAETAVPAGTLVDRVLNYYWFFGAFAAGLVLFIVVLGARRS